MPTLQNCWREVCRRWMSGDESESAMLPQPDHHDDHSPGRRDPVPFSEAELEWQFRSRNSLEGARWSAMKAAFIGPLPIVAFAAVGLILSETDKGESVFAEMFCLFGGMLGLCAIYVLLTGIVFGWIAHRFAFETVVPVSRLAIAIAWVANLSLWGWTLVFVLARS